MLKKFLSNCKKPTRKFGKMIVSAMNKGHAPLALWAFEVCPLKDEMCIRDRVEGVFDSSVEFHMRKAKENGVSEIGRAHV